MEKYYFHNQKVVFEETKNFAGFLRIICGEYFFPDYNKKTLFLTFKKINLI